MGNPNNHIIVIIRVDANKSGTITPQELQAALVNGNGTEFNMTTINMMIGERVTDKSWHFDKFLLCKACLTETRVER